MGAKLLDTNVILRYLVEDPEDSHSKYVGVFRFFKKLEQNLTSVDMPDLVLFEAFFVLKSFYKVPVKAISQKLINLIGFRGILMKDKELLKQGLLYASNKKIDFVDGCLAAQFHLDKIEGIYSYDSDLKKLGCKVLRPD